MRKEIAERFRTAWENGGRSTIVAAGVRDKTAAEWKTSPPDAFSKALAALAEDGWNLNWIFTGTGPERFDSKNAHYSDIFARFSRLATLLGERAKDDPAAVADFLDDLLPKSDSLPGASAPDEEHTAPGASADPA